MTWPISYSTNRASVDRPGGSDAGATTVAATRVVVSLSGRARVTVGRRVVEGIWRPSSRASDFRTSSDVDPGVHHVSFTNGHAPRESVYMANALMPDTGGIVIERQRHSPDQRQLSLDYSVERASSVRTSSVAMAGLVAAVLLVRVTRARVR